MGARGRSHGRARALDDGRRRRPPARRLARGAEGVAARAARHPARERAHLLLRRPARDGGARARARAHAALPGPAPARAARRARRARGARRRHDERGERLQRPQRAPSCGRGLADPSPLVADEALRSLRRLDYRDGFDPLARIFREATDERVRAVALEAIAGVGTFEAGLFLLDLVRQETGALAEAAAERLAELPGRRARARRAPGRSRSRRASAAPSSSASSRGWPARAARRSPRGDVTATAMSRRRRGRARRAARRRARPRTRSWHRTCVAGRA